MSKYDLDDVVDRLENVEAAIKSNHIDFSVVWLVVLIWLVLFVWLPDGWYSKTRLSFWYGVGSDQVTIDKEPHDCNFWHSPIGGKGCKYDRQVSTVQVKPNRWGGQSISYDEGKSWTQTGKSAEGSYPIESNDDGKTWATLGGTIMPETKASVNVGWSKVDD